MTQANNVDTLGRPELAIIVQPEHELDRLMDEAEDPDGSLENQPDGDGKPGKGRSSRSSSRVKKKHYTEDYRQHVLASFLLPPTSRSVRQGQDGAIQSALGGVHCQKVYESRIIVPRSDSGR